jgi:VWFA-related protein
MRKHVTFAATLTALLLFTSAFIRTTRTHAQEQQPQTQTPSAQATPTPQDDSDDGDVVRITTNLVQFDAIVTDKGGRQVIDLRPEDFEVTVGGRRQTITNVSYVVAQPNAVAPAPATTAARANDKSAPYVPPARVRPGDVRRTVALVVDDLGTSFESMTYVRQALKKFVDEQMQPGDLVAVVRTSAGMGALQQFTSDKNLLYRAIERVRWYPSGRSGVSAFAALESVGPFDPAKSPGGTQGRDGKEDDKGNPDPSEQLDEFHDQVFSVGTLGALSFVVRGMQELPGRKSIVMFSDGFEIMNRQVQGDGSRRYDRGDSSRVMESLRRLVDQANRASVVVYTVDARGLPFLGLSAEDSTTGRSAQEVRGVLNDRSAKYFNTQEGLNYLAQETGGLFMHDRNDLSGAVSKALDDQKGYYLIGFRPDEDVFRIAGGRSHFNDLGVKVKRQGLRVRHRSGFMGVPDSEAKPVRTTRLQQLVGALSSPFASGDVRLRLTSLFGGDPANGAVVSSLMHIDMSGIKFTEEADGWHKAVIDLIALTFGDEGNVVDEINRTETVRVRGAAFDIVRRNGLIYQMHVPVKKPGAYQLRVAVRDASTEKLGAASQFIEVPDLKRDRLAVSGIVLQSSRTTAAVSAGGEQTEPDPEGNAAVRRFHKGEQVDYFINIYNARLDKATGRPRLQTQMRLFRDRDQVYAGPLTEFDPASQTDMKTLHAAARIRVNGLQPGEYVLQIIVTDTLAPEKRRTVTQWMDFEVIQ